VAVAGIGALEKFIQDQLTPEPGIELIRAGFACFTGARDRVNIRRRHPDTRRSRDLRG
jgi:hypothetical protein